MPENNDNTGESGQPDASHEPIETPPVASSPPATTPLATAAAAAPPAPPIASGSKGGTGLAALIVGIVAMVFAVIPGLCFIAFIPALVALVLGIVALAKKHPRRGRALSGVILGAVALVVAIIVSVVFIASLAASVPISSSSKSSDTIVPETKTNEAPAQKTEPTQAAEAPVPADVAYSGTGDSVVKIAIPDGADSPGVATITHTGQHNFAVWGLNDSMAKQGLLVNEIGAYTGTVLFNSGMSTGVTSLAITADGAWTVTLHSLKSLREFTGNSVAGTGDDVVVYRGKAGAATISHAGQHNFAVWFYGSQTDLLVNEIGAYNGTVAWSSGPAVIAVTADGNWNIAVN